MNQKNVIVLGGGLVGGPMAVDLAKNDEFKVTVADISENVLDGVKKREPKIETLRADLSDAATVKKMAGPFDLVLSAVPGFMGYQTLQAIIEAKKDVVDIAFFPEDPFGLDEAAKKSGVTAIVDCGVAPGLSNLLVGHVNEELDALDTALIYVGGLPEVRTWPFEYKAVFSPIDVIEEYTRPARYIENGSVVIREALSDPEFIDFKKVGTLEAFNTDGLRTLAETISAPNLKEKTLRYPGHIEKMAVFRETGLFSQEEIEVNGVRVRPLDVTAKLMFPKWKLLQGEVDITVMRVIVEGKKGDRTSRFTFDLFDKYDADTDTHSMARTTGYTATAAIRMLAEGMYDVPGVTPPELLAKKKGCFDFILERLRERNIVCSERIES